MRDWTRSQEIVRDWEIAGTIESKSPSGTPVTEACQAFMADLEAQHQSKSSLKKYRGLLVNEYTPEQMVQWSPSLTQFCKHENLQFTSQIGLPELTRFRSQWKDKGIASNKKRERLIAFGRFLADRGWWKENIASKLKPSKASEPPTLPYTREEVGSLLAACDDFTDGRGKTGRENAHRLRAFILFLRYSGLRIGDAAGCDVERLAGNRIFLYMQKTGVPVYIPLPYFVVNALSSCPRKSERFWFWTGAGSKDTLTGNWRRTFRRLCQLAGVQNGHPHRFRDTLAVEMLMAGTPIERVSILLGHSSVKITERHYAPWVKERQAQLEADVARSWATDPVAQAEQLRDEMSVLLVEGQRMAATPQRHEKRDRAN